MKTPLRIALYQPDIPQNVGAMIRLAACMGAGLDIIEPCGFLWDERRIRQSAMDYFERTSPVRYESWKSFEKSRSGRLVLMSTKASIPYVDFAFQKEDILLAGRESAGVPQEVHDAADARVFIPMRPGLRSLNVVNASAMILGEALRQIDGFEKETGR